MPANHLQTIETLLRALEQHDLEPFRQLLSDQAFVYELRPPAVGAANPKLTDGKANKQQFIEMLGGGTPWKAIKFHEPLRTVVGPSSIYYHCLASGELVTGAPYNNEYIFVLDFDEEGKATSLLEFVDSAHTLKVFGELAALAAASGEA
ncbi:hypothetical protein JCM8097_007309 [Rhodosporidiobolus ruineniae]